MTLPALSFHSAIVKFEHDGRCSKLLKHILLFFFSGDHPSLFSTHNVEHCTFVNQIYFILFYFILFSTCS
jgi:hypothetical protein